ncbi:CdaR family transcriptional regulator [Ammoniphilus resinae]|uniref:Carbohydrate diacid regulator n=1 Tax=Ammoniphilus resinae TaxID=861532 RepID=A0ABS4GIV2_9BACL|nr:sugar diacid recognition domain-containing protein [Ammoniphilus resinae]MBP1930022.1 carbohydrate diacid regulator [Ammoniphilus resinae]
MLTHDIAEEIVRETMVRLNRNINIMDATGTILASGHSSRVGQVHEGALEVLATGLPLVVTEENEHLWKGTKSGINLPIFLQDRIIGVIGISGKKEEVEVFADLVKMTTELMVKQSFLASQSEWKQRLKETTLQDLIGAHPRWEFIDQKLDLLQIRLTPPFQVAVLQFQDKFSESVKLTEFVDRLLGPFHLSAFIAVNRFLILSSESTQEKLKEKLLQLQNKLRELHFVFSLGVGTETQNWEEISVSYEEAQMALFLKAEFCNEVTFFEKNELHALITQLDENWRKRFLNRTFSSLSQKEIKTLDAFLASNLNITEAAIHMAIHRNTLLYRLKQIKEKTRLDPQLFQDAVTLQAAVWMLKREGTWNSR